MPDDSKMLKIEPVTQHTIEKERPEQKISELKTLERTATKDSMKSPLLVSPGPKEPIIKMGAREEEFSVGTKPNTADVSLNSGLLYVDHNTGNNTPLTASGDKNNSMSQPPPDFDSIIPSNPDFNLEIKNVESSSKKNSAANGDEKKSNEARKVKRGNSDHSDNPVVKEKSFEIPKKE